MSYTKINDPGHGWVGVPLSELAELDIAKLITSCSYRDGNLIWLEEDWDVGIWICALAKQNNKTPVEQYEEMLSEQKIVSTHVEQTYIRQLPMYQCVGGEQCI